MIAARFRRVARRHAGRTALDDGASPLTYRDLERRVDGVARAVAGAAAPGAPVLLLMDQGTANVVATLGVLAAGAAFAPLDRADPPARLREIADLLATPLVLTDAAGASAAEALRDPGRPVLRVDLIAPADAGPSRAAAPGDLASVYFTSGTTGGPKGVMDSHANVLDNALRYTRTLRLRRDDRLSLIQAPAFSGTASSMFGALLNGAALVPVPVATTPLPRLAAAIRERRVTVYHSVPSIFRSILAVDPAPFPDVRVVRLEGDRATSADAALFRERFGPAAILANGLGTTETGLCRQLRLSPRDAVAEGALPVGHATPGVEVRVIGHDGTSVPEGEAGEIAVRGRRLALGYWGRPDLTAAAFSADPGDPGLREYRTGDLGRLRPDGCLEYLGRRDGALKVDGVRVEPAEVEAALLELPGVDEAAVTTYPGRRGEGRLAAYLVVDGTGPDHLGIRAALLARLPAAMVPATLMFVERLPVTAGGKIDRAALGAPGARRPGRPPADDEALLLALWERILERDGLGVDDDFFAVGGDSLAAAELLAALEGREGRPIADTLLLRAPTVARMAAELRAEGRGAPASGIVPLQPLGARAPLVVTHGADFSTNTYAWLVRRLGVDRPVWGLDAPAGGGRLAALADAHARALVGARGRGPHLLAGFCSGGIVALEVARRLRASGADVALVALIGVGAIDFPTLVSPDAAARHRRATPRPGLRGRARSARALVTRRPDPARRMLRGHRPEPLPGSAVLLLSREGAARDGADPAADWAGLADAVRVELVDGGVDALMHEPVVTEVARRLEAAMAEGAG